MLIYDPHTNCLLEWHIPNWPQPLKLTGWGCEVGDWFGFFAHERLGGRNCRIVNRQLEPVNGNRLASSWDITLPQGKFSIKLVDEFISPNSLFRNLSVKNIAPEFSWVGDAVIRMVVPWEEGLIAQLEQRNILHENKNYYYDTEESEVALKWADGRHLVIKWMHPLVSPPTFTPYLYVRDQMVMAKYGHMHCDTRAWVIHARLLVDQPASFVYRWSRFLLWDRSILGRYFISARRLAHRWRAGEWRLPGRSSLYGLWPLYPDQELQLSIMITAT